MPRHRLDATDACRSAPRRTREFRRQTTAALVSRANCDAPPGHRLQSGTRIPYRKRPPRNPPAPIAGSVDWSEQRRPRPPAPDSQVTALDAPVTTDASLPRNWTAMETRIVPAPTAASWRDEARADPAAARRRAADNGSARLPAARTPECR